MSEGERVVRTAISPVRLIADFVRSSVGAKVVMAVTGFLLWAFVIGHLVGNLQIFQGSEPMNAYGVFLRSIGHGTAIWVVRGGLAATFILHIVTGIRLAALNRAARGPVSYAKNKPRRTTMAALTMASSGILILAFLVFHLAHFTWGTVLPEFAAFTDEQGRHDVFKMVWNGFSVPWVVVVYVVGQVLVLSHLYHGTQSLFQSLGFNHPVWTPAIRVLGRAVAFLILAGNVSIPLTIFFLWGKP